MLSQDILFERIQKLPKLTPAETRIADYFQRNRSVLAFETATSISRRTELSKATVVRFVSRLGYDGFADFQEKLKNEFMARLKSPIERYSVNKNRTEGDAKDYLEEQIALTITNLGKLRKRIDSELLTKVTRLLALSKGKIYVMGMLTSFSLAQNFWSKANYLRPGVILMDNGFSALPNRLVNVSPEDVLLAVTHRRYSRQAELAIQYFVGLGAKVILLTDSDLSPFSSLADFQLVAASEGPQLFDTNCPMLILIESLLEAMADLLEINIQDRFKSMDNLYEHFETFSPGLDYTLGQRIKKRRVGSPGALPRGKGGRE